MGLDSIFFGLIGIGLLVNIYVTFSRQFFVQVSEGPLKFIFSKTDGYSSANVADLSADKIQHVD